MLGGGRRIGCRGDIVRRRMDIGSHLVCGGIRSCRLSVSFHYVFLNVFNSFFCGVGWGVLGD